MKIIILQGLPASGKSTWAKEYVKTNPNTKRINKDLLRKMLDFSKWSKANEKTVLRVRNELIKLLLIKGNDVIVDDTNLAEKHIQTIAELAKSVSDTIGKKIELEINNQFLSVPVEECIKRDLKRPESVGKDVIMSMYEKYIRVKPTKLKQDTNLHRAIIVDIDGTLAYNDGHRGFFEWGKVGGDRVNTEIADLVNTLSEEYVVVVMSGRDSICRNETEKRLRDNDIHFDKLFMRKENDMRADEVIKKELFNDNVKGKYYVEFVLDDRNKVVNMWRELGLRCLQVAEGNF